MIGKSLIMILRKLRAVIIDNRRIEYLRGERAGCVA